MKQIIPWGSADNLSNAATEYAPIVGGGGWDPTEGYVPCPIPTAGKLRNLRVVLSAAPTNNAYKITLRKDGGNTALTVTIAVGSTTAELTGVDVSVAAGERVNYMSHFDAAPGNTPMAYICVEFESNTPGESIILSVARRGVDTDHYGPLMNHAFGVNLSTADVFGARTTFPTGGTLKKLYCYGDLGDAINFLDFTIYKDGAVTNLSANWNGACTPDNADTVAVVDGSYCQMKVIETGALSTTRIAWGMVFAPATDGEFLMMFSGTDEPASGEYNGLTTFYLAGPWSVNENNSRLFSKCTAKKLRADIAIAPGAGNGRTFCLRKSATSDTDLTVTFGAADTSKSITANVSIANLERYIYKHTDSGAPAASGGIQLSLVCTLPFSNPLASNVGKLIVAGAA